jgi:hypothetical protein
LACVNAEGCRTLIKVGLVEAVINPGSACQAVLTFVKSSPQGHDLIPKLLGPQGSSGGKRFTVNLPEVKGRLLSAVDEADRSRHHQAGLSLVFFQTLFKISSHLVFMKIYLLI